MATSSSIIHYSLQVCRIFIGLSVVLLFGFICFLIIGYLSPATVGNVDISDLFNPGFGIGNIIVGSTASSVGKTVTMKDINLLTVFWLILRAIIFFLIAIGILLKVIRILKSIKSPETFYVDNVKDFRVLAKYGLAGFVMSSFNLGVINQSWEFRVAPILSLLLFSGACLVLSEVFNEGRLLLEDKQSIV